MEPLTPAGSTEEDQRRGKMIVDLLGLKPAKNQILESNSGYDPTTYNTESGPKTAIGLYRLMVRIVLDGEV